MRKVFADTLFWVGMWNPKDEHNASAKRSWERGRKSRLITTDTVLVEVLNAFSSFGSDWRNAVAESVEKLLNEPNVTVIRQTPDLFNQALQLYKSRLDKSYSLTDCISMVVMKKEQIEDVLSSDRHFEQGGFSLLMKL